jgi:positive regulator of sigma E activity
MKNNKFSKSSLILLITGLLLVSLVPLLSRYVEISDMLKGFFTGIGLSLEFLAIVKMSKKNNYCRSATGFS